jgi:hypothetical protein
MRRPVPTSIGSLVKFAIVAMMVFAGLFVPSPAAGYSVLAHEANIDALWDTTIKPMLRVRFPGTTPEALLEARAYAYGGCVIQDLGYYPFGSHFFSNLLHYVRTGDFVEALIRDAQETYGIEMKGVFLNEDLAIATYRHAVGTTIPEMTKVTWGKKRDQILKVTPGMATQITHGETSGPAILRGVDSLANAVKVTSRRCHTKAMP